MLLVFTLRSRIALIKISLPVFDLTFDFLFGDVGFEDIYS